MADLVWWLSYATKDDGFKGVVITMAPTFIEACAKARYLGLSPGGQVRGYSTTLDEAQDEIDRFGLDYFITPEEISQFNYPSILELDNKTEH